MSIPILDIHTGTIHEKYRNYKTLIKESSIEEVIERTREGSNELEDFKRVPPKITRYQLRQLFRPDYLAPELAILLRFSPRYVILRSARSYEFWLRYYSIRFFFQYIEHLCFLQETAPVTEKPEFLARFVVHLGRKVGLKHYKRVDSLLREYLSGKIHFKILEDRLEALYSMEFHFEQKSSAFPKMHISDLTVLLKDRREFQHFLSHNLHMFSMFLEIIGTLILRKTIKEIPLPILRALYIYSKKMDILLDLIKGFTSEHEKNHILDAQLKRDKRKRQRVVKSLYLICLFYFEITDFLRDYWEKNAEFHFKNGK